MSKTNKADITSLSPYLPVTKEEVLLIAERQGAYMDTINKKKSHVVESMHWYDELIQQVDAQGNRVSKMAAEKLLEYKKDLSKELDNLMEEEHKFLIIYLAVINVDGELRELLTGNIQEKARKLPEGQRQPQRLYRLRRKTLNHILQECGQKYSCGS